MRSSSARTGCFALFGKQVDTHSVLSPVGRGPVGIRRGAPDRHGIGRCRGVVRPGHRQRGEGSERGRQRGSAVVARGHLQRPIRPTQSPRGGRGGIQGGRSGVHSAAVRWLAGGEHPSQPHLFADPAFMDRSWIHAISMAPNVRHLHARGRVPGATFRQAAARIRCQVWFSMVLGDRSGLPRDRIKTVRVDPRGAPSSGITVPGSTSTRSPRTSRRPRTTCCGGSSPSWRCGPGRCRGRPRTCRASWSARTRMHPPWVQDFFAKEERSDRR